MAPYLGCNPFNRQLEAWLVVERKRGNLDSGGLTGDLAGQAGIKKWIWSSTSPQCIEVLRGNTHDNARCNTLLHCDNYCQLGRLWETAGGLNFEVVLPGTNYSNDLLSSVRRRDISQAAIDCLPTSTHFENRGGLRVRVIEQAVLGLVSVCSFAAFDCGISVSQQDQQAATAVADREFLKRLGISGKRV